MEEDSKVINLDRVNHLTCISSHPIKVMCFNLILCNTAYFTEKNCVKQSKIGLRTSQIKTSELKAHVYINDSQG